MSGNIWNRFFELGKGKEREIPTMTAEEFDEFATTIQNEFSVNLKQLIESVSGSRNFSAILTSNRTNSITLHVRDIFLSGFIGITIEKPSGSLKFKVPLKSIKGRHHD